MELRAAGRPEIYTRVSNGSFEADTSGWAVTAGINAAGTSVTRITSDAFTGSASAQVVTAAAASSGVNYDFASWPFESDASCAVLVAVRLRVKYVSGARGITVAIGSEGTSANRASRDVTLGSSWSEVMVLWRPQARVTDAQLALMTADDRAATFLVDAVEVFHPQLSQVENGSYLSSTVGWVTNGSAISGSATSMTWLPSGGPAVHANGTIGPCAELVGDGAAGSGTDTWLGGKTFTADTTHRLRLMLRGVSGTDQVRLRFGSNGAADRADETVTVTGEWASYTLDWTPAAERTDCAVSVSAGAASALTIQLADVEVYEASDELTPRFWEATRGASFDGSGNPPGQAGGEQPDLDGTYTPWNAAGSLYPAVRDSIRRVMVYGRASYGGRAYGLCAGRITAIAPDPYGKVSHLTIGDGLLDISGVLIQRAFTAASSFSDARADALDAAGVSAWQRDLDTGGPERATFYDGTDEAVSALSYLEDLNQATGTIHVADPSPHANVAWLYRTTNRAAVSDSSVSPWSYDDDSRGPLAGAETRDESVITASRATWGGYEQLPVRDPAGTLDLPWGSEAAAAGYGTLAIGGDPSQWPSLVPYLTFRRSEYGSFEPPEPEVVVAVKRLRGRKRKRWLVRYDDRVFPLTVPAGTSRTLSLDFDAHIEGMDVRYQATNLTVSLAAEPARATVTVTAGATDGTLSALAIIGRPWRRTDEVEVSESVGSSAYGGREPEDLTAAYVNGPGQAEGLVRYHLWRYDRARLRPALRDALEPARMLGMPVGQTLDITLAKYLLATTPFAITNITHTIGRPDAHEWHVEVTAEELPADAGPWVTIGGGAAAGIGGGRRLAR